MRASASPVIGPLSLWNKLNLVQTYDFSLLSSPWHFLVHKAQSRIHCLRAEEKKDSILAFVDMLGLRMLPIRSEPGLKELVTGECNQPLPQEGSSPCWRTGWAPRASASSPVWSSDSASWEAVFPGAPSLRMRTSSHGLHPPRPHLTWCDTSQGLVWGRQVGRLQSMQNRKRNHFQPK